jgi:hypothetical protein
MTSGTGVMTTELDCQLSRLKHGDHICLIYENTAGQVAAACPFIKEGLARGERCVYVAGDRSFEEVVRALRAAGVDVAQECRRGALLSLADRDVYLQSGSFDQQRMIDFVRQVEAQALADGFSGVRFTGVMTPALWQEVGDAFSAYESLLNRLPLDRSVILCQYHRWQLDAPCIHDVVRTHPLAVLGDQLCPNPYYEPPEVVLDRDPMVASSEFQAKRVDWWVAQLRRARTAEQQRERMLERLHSLSRRLVEVQEAERGHPARELHDEIGQVLSMVSVNLHALKEVCDPPAWPQLEEDISIVAGAIQQVRNLALDLPALLRVGASPQRVIAQFPGEVLWVRASVFDDWAGRGDVLAHRLPRYISTFLTQVAQLAACNALHSLERPCCRWLLMAHDRVGTDEFPLTHQLLSQMLGVRRAGVTEVAGPLQEGGLIRYRRGSIVILDRKGLAAAACECYQVIRAEYDRLLG